MATGFKMLQQALNRVLTAFRIFESRVYAAIIQHPITDFQFALDTRNIDGSCDELKRNRPWDENEGKSLLDSVLGDGILWAVPVRRRTIEVRLSRRLGHTKVFKLKRNLVVCNVCLHYHEAHTVCGNCYAKVKLETEAMQEAIQKKLQLNPVEKEVTIVYNTGEKLDLEDPKYKDKILVDMEKPPPPWFSKNLLTRAYLPKVDDYSLSPDVNSEKK